MFYPVIDPIALHLGPIQIHWYGLMYLFGFASAWLLARVRAPKQNPAWSSTDISDLIFYSALGVLLGGRVGYMLFYDFADLLAHPLSLFEVWEGGMSFHGGLLGVLVSMVYFAYKTQRHFFTVTDFVAPLVPLGLAAGRLGNFINAELWGRVTDLPWAMVFPGGGPAPRHPSQLYEFLLEGLVLFMMVWLYSAKPRPRMAVSGLFALSYGVFRFSVEFFREPDVQLGFVGWNYLTMGQLLTIPLILTGIVLLTLAYRNQT